MPSTDNDSALFSRTSSPTLSVSAEIEARSRTNASRIVNGLAIHGHKGVADVYGKDISMVSKWKNDGEFDRIAAMLAVLGLKVVPAAWQLVDMDQVNAMITLTRAHIKNLASADQLITGES